MRTEADVGVSSSWVLDPVTTAAVCRFTADLGPSGGVGQWLYTPPLSTSTTLLPLLMGAPSRSSQEGLAEGRPSQEVLQSHAALAIWAVAIFL